MTGSSPLDKSAPPVVRILPMIVGRTVQRVREPSSLDCLQAPRSRPSTI